MKQNRWIVIILSIGILLGVTGLVFLERLGIKADSRISDVEELSPELLVDFDHIEGREKESLLIVDSSENSQAYREMMSYILEEMSVGYDIYEISEDTLEEMPNLEQYQTVIYSSKESEWMIQSNNIQVILEWVKEGGRFFSLMPDINSQIFTDYSKELGIKKINSKMADIYQIDFLTDFMIGSEGFSYELDSFETYGLDVTLMEDVIIHAKQTDSDTPIIWEKGYGKGRIVVNNIDMNEKSARGMYAAQYSLLEDTFAYPVINSSIFFIDDFPAPMPDGYNRHISNFYEMELKSFFTNIWLPDIMEISSEYQIPFTSVMIATYKDDTAPPYDEAVDREFFSFFANLVNQTNGEIGYHGYNHQPLTLDGFDFKGELAYKHWNSIEEMFASLDALIEIRKWIFPEDEASVYVPPSNILSAEARKAMPEYIPDIQTIASLYIVENFEYGQEFTVADDGLVELPRTASGLSLSDYDWWLSMNELNFHFVNSHFFHPDDLLDEERGAAQGWESLQQSFREYLDWLKKIAPGLRNQTASDAAKMVQRYDVATLKRMEDEDTYRIEIANFYDALDCIIRVRDKEIKSVEGGSLTPLTSEVYLLHAEKNIVTIQYE